MTANDLLDAVNAELSGKSGGVLPKGTEVNPPTTVGGEFSSGFSRGVDSLQEVTFGAGALAADWLGLDSTKDYLLKKVTEQEREIAMSPSGVPSYKDVEGPSSLARYLSSQLGQGLPMLGESLATGLIAGGIGSAVAPGLGTAGGAIAGFLERGAIKKIIKDRVKDEVTDELEHYAAGAFPKTWLSEGSQALVNESFKKQVARTSATGFQIPNAVGLEMGSIYAESSNDPNTKETDRKWAATLGGLLAGLSEGLLDAYVVGKFFPGVSSVSQAELEKAKGFIMRFGKEFGKEFIKVSPAEALIEYGQTWIEEASKNWADPSKRDNIFNMTDEQKYARVDAAIGGFVMGGPMGLAAGLGTTLNRPHPDIKVRRDEADIISRANDIVPLPEPTEEDRILEAIRTKISTTEASLKENPDNVELQKELEGLREAERIQVESMEEPEEELPKPPASFQDKYKKEGEQDEKETESEKSEESKEEDKEKKSSGVLLSPIVGIALVNKKTGAILAEGKIGQEHKDIKTQEMLAEVDDPFEDIEHGFIDEDKKFLSRTAAARRLFDRGEITEDEFNKMISKKIETGLSSQELRDIVARQTKVEVKEPPKESKKKIEKPQNVPPAVPSPSSVIKELTRASYAKEMPILGRLKASKRRISKAVVAEAKGRLHRVIDLLTIGSKGTLNEEGAKEYNRQLKEAFTDEMIALIAGQDIEVQWNKSGKLEVDHRGKKGGILLRLPDYTSWVNKYGAQLAKDDKELAASKQAKSRSIPDVIAHEVIHLADMVQIRDAWQKGDQEQSFVDYEHKVVEERGRVLKSALPKLKKHKGISRILREVYEPGEAGGATNQQLGAEFLRMMVEMARTGKINEFTDALAAAEIDTDLNEDGKITQFVQAWLEAIRAIRDMLVKMMGVDAPAEIKEAFQNINQVLDRYNVLIDKSIGLVNKRAKVKPKETESKAEIKEEKKVPIEQELPPEQALIVTTPVDTSSQLEQSESEESIELKEINPKEAKAPRKKKSDSEKLNDLAKEISSRTRKHFENLSKAPETRIRGSQVDLEGVEPHILEYTTQTNKNSIRLAQQHVDVVGGTLKAIEILNNDPLGIGFEITNAEGEDVLGPDGILNAIYELLMDHLSLMSKEMEGDHSFTGPQKAMPLLKFQELKKTWAKLGTEGGQFNQGKGKTFKTWNAMTAKESYIDPTLAHLNKVLGKKASALVKDLSEEINSLVSQYVNGIVDKASLIAYFRDFYKQARTRKFQTEQRKVIAKNEKAMQKITRRSSKRAAEYIALDKEGKDRLKSIKESIVKMLGGSGRVPNGPKSYEQIFNSVVRKVAIDAAERVGLVNEKEALKKTSIEDQFKAILLNDILYAQFVRDLYTAYVQEHGGKNPSKDFMDEANQLYNELANRAWTESMVDSLMAKKMRELEMKFSKFASESYKDGELNREFLSLSIKSELEESGIQNDDLLEQLVQDIDEDFEDSLQSAREKFFGSAKGIRDNLESIQNFLGMVPKKMGEIAVEHRSLANTISDSLEDYLRAEYALPDTQASQFSRLLQRELNNQLLGGVDEKGNVTQGAVENTIQKWVRQATRNSSPKVKKQATQAIDKIIRLSNTGVMRREDIYNQLAKEFGLPKYDPEVARDLEMLGDRVGLTGNERLRNTLKQEMLNLIHSKTGVKTMEVYTAWYYISMLFGIGTQIVNVAGNTGVFAGQLLVESTKNPRKALRMFTSLFGSAVGVGQLEARETFFTGGESLGKEDTKYFLGPNAMEMIGPEIVSDLKWMHLPAGLTARLEAIDKTVAEGVHRYGRHLRYVTRSLQATDIFFYKAEQEAKYVGETGDYITSDMWESALKDAKLEMLADGQDPDADRASKRRMQVIARDIVERRRLDSEDKKLKWVEASSLAMDATLQNEPKGFWGGVAKRIEQFVGDFPVGKLIVPFTKVAANFINHTLEWTPWGFARWAISPSFMKEFKDEFGNTQMKRDEDILRRAVLGTGMMMLLMWRMGYEDEDDPEFTIYADGPRDPNKRRQLMDRGWRPHTVKFGNTYFSYLYTPLSMGLAIVGKHMDRFRDGEVEDVSDISLSSSIAAIMNETMNQSFLMGLTNLVSAVDSSNPERKLSQLFARTVTTPFIPNIVRQVDNYVRPTVYQSEGFIETFVKESVVAKSTLKPMINNLGREVKRFRGPFPGTERFLTYEKTDDPVLNLISEKKLTLPGFSKNTQVGDRNIDREEFYEYVQRSGQMADKQIHSELMRLRSMTNEEAQKRVDKIYEEAKDKVRKEIRTKALVN